MPARDRRVTVPLDNTIHKTTALLDADSRLALGYLQDLFARLCGKRATSSAVVRLALVKLAYALQRELLATTAREDDLQSISRDLMRASKGSPAGARTAARAEARLVQLAETPDDQLPTFSRFLNPDGPDMEEVNRRVEESLNAIGVKTRV